MSDQTTRHGISWSRVTGMIEKLAHAETGTDHWAAMHTGGVTEDERRLVQAIEDLVDARVRLREDKHK